MRARAAQLTSQSLTAADTTNSGVQSGPAANITVLGTSVALANDPTATGEQALVIIVDLASPP